MRAVCDATSIFTRRAKRPVSETCATTASTASTASTGPATTV
ncbi:Uncharacterised protein [Mycobacteroides abscessus subsp. abscessus]|nr:Uncharacterised protein [Mycobacteroides abscessus subsp. abscessus]